MKSEDVARELVRIAKKLMEEKEAGLGRMSGEKKAGSMTIGDGDTDDLTDELRDELTKYFRGSDDINKNEIFFYEEYTRSGKMARVEVTVDPRNQPDKAGQRGFCLGVYTHREGFEAGTLYEGCWTDPNDWSVAKEAKVIANIARKVLLMN